MVASFFTRCLMADNERAGWPVRQRIEGTPEPMRTWHGANGIRLAGDCWGAPDAPPVVLLHGAGQTRHAWRNTGVRLGQEGYYAIAYDARGHGDSAWCEQGAYHEDALVDDLVATVRTLGLQRPVLIGASMGGITSLLAYGAQRVDARALILVDIVPRIEPKGFDRVRAFMRQQIDGFESLQSVSNAISQYRGTAPREDLSGLVKNLRKGEDGRLYWHWDPKFIITPRNLDTRHDRLADCAQRLQIPTMVVRGGHSDVVSEEGIREFLALCPHAEYSHIGGAGHMVAGDRNDLFGNKAIEFLGRVAIREHKIYPFD